MNNHIQTTISYPELGLIAMTRGFLGAGLALLLGDRLSQEQRKAVGWTLFSIGLITTVPLAVDVFFKSKQLSAMA